MLEIRWMNEYEEGLLVVAVYVFVVTVFTLPFLITYLFIKITKTVNRANKLLGYLYESEEESRKYHE